MGRLSYNHGPIWLSQRVPKKKTRAKWNSLFDFSICYSSQGLASPENVGWNPKALEGSNVVSYPRKIGNLGVREGVS